MEQKLNHKTAVITGGGTGIGRSCALMLAKQGCNCVLNYSHSKIDAENTACDVEKLGVGSAAIKADVTSDKEMRHLALTAAKKFRSIDILINSAGITRYIDMDDLDGVHMEAWDSIMNTNVKGAFLSTRACAAYLAKAKGTVVNVTSIAGFMGRGSCLPYAVSKGALITLTKALARSMAPEVRVNAVAPGIVNTRWVNGRKEHIDKQSSGTLLGRIAEAGDIAEAIMAFILHGGFVTGQTLIVDGGFYI